MSVRAALAAMAVTLCCVFAAASAAARDKPIPKEPDKFTSYMADRFSAAMPGLNVAVRGTLELEIIVDGRPHQVRLINVWDFCERSRADCRKAVDGFLANMPGAMQEGEVSEKPENIRAVVRGSGYIAELRRMAGKDPQAAALFRPVAGDLWMICVLDLPHGIQPITKGQLDKLGLSDDQAIALGLKNLAASLKPLAADTHVLKKLGLKFATGDFYESSRMLLHDDWAAMAKAMGGHLVVAVPETDMIIYGNGGGNGDRLVLSAFAQTVLEKAPKPISGGLFEWTETG